MGKTNLATAGALDPTLTISCDASFLPSSGTNVGIGHQNITGRCAIAREIYGGEK